MRASITRAGKYKYTNPARIPRNPVARKLTHVHFKFGKKRSAYVEILKINQQHVKIKYTDKKPSKLGEFVDEKKEDIISRFDSNMK